MGVLHFRGPPRSDRSRSSRRPATASARPAPAQRGPAPVIDAFRDLHGSSLHGFALLVTLGDERIAERAAGEALFAGSGRASELRHPERAAAWLRARVLQSVRRRLPLGPRPTAVERHAALRPLGVDRAVFHGLEGLRPALRAALVASAVERFEPIDVETILGSGPARTRRLIEEARRRYLVAVAAGPASELDDALPAIGELAQRVETIAARALSPEAGAE